MRSFDVITRAITRATTFSALLWAMVPLTPLATYAADTPATAATASATPASGEAKTAPAELVKKVADDVLSEIKQDTSLQKDASKLHARVSSHLAPHFDFTRLTQLAMGRHWRTATPEQRQQLSEQFSRLLVRTYSNALVNYRNQEIEYLPTKAAPAGVKDVVVRTRVHGGGKSPVAIDYTLMATPGGWKAYDVTVAGISLVTNYRDEFNEVIRNKGIEGLVERLKEKNTKPVPPVDPLKNS